jgi:hypothetical protein
VYHRRLFDTANQCEPPLTTMPPPDDELTPLDDWSPSDDEVDDDDEVDVDDESVGEEEVPEVAAVELEEVEDPGIVAALTALNTPTAPMAARAAPVVRRLSVRIAASRARILVSVSFLVLSMFSKACGPALNRAWELAERWLRSIALTLGRLFRFYC